MLVEHTETVYVIWLPGLSFTAKVQNRGIVHYPFDVVFAGAAKYIVIIVSGVVIP